MRILIIGGSGQLGSDFLKVAAGRHEVIAPPHEQADVTDGQAVERVVLEHRPQVVVNAAAFHKVELCEQDPARAFQVNAVGAWNSARAAKAAGARAVFLSSDYVFDGEESGGYREDDPTRPLSVYGASKVAGEHATRIACPDPLIVRGSGLFGHAGSSGKGGNFVETMLAKAEAGEAISVVDDQVFSPTSTHDLAERLLLLLEHEAPPGIYHAANSGSCSWHGLAREVFAAAGVSADLSPRPAGEQPVRRPRCSILLDTKSAPLGLAPSRPWQEALRWYLEHRTASPPAVS